MEAKKGQLFEEAISSFILQNGDVIVALVSSYNFFSADLELILEVPIDQIADGLKSITQFKHCSEKKEVGFIQMAKIADLKKLKETAKRHKCTISEHLCKQTTVKSIFFMAFVMLKDDKPHVLCWPLEKNSMILHFIEDPHVLELSEDKYLVKNLIVQSM